MSLPLDASGDTKMTETFIVPKRTYNEMAINTTKLVFRLWVRYKYKHVKSW